MYRIVYLGNVSRIAKALSRMDGIRLVGCIYEDAQDANDFVKLYTYDQFQTFRVQSQEELKIALSMLQPIDLGVIANFGLILTPANISQARRGFVNAHPGLLPDNPGRFPILGDSRTGVYRSPNRRRYPPAKPDHRHCQC